MTNDMLDTLIRDRARKHGLACVNTIEEVSILHPSSPSREFLVLYHRTGRYHRSEVFTYGVFLQKALLGNWAGSTLGSGKLGNGVVDWEQKFVDRETFIW